MPDTYHPADALIVALDVPSVADARALAADLTGTVGAFKIGHELLLGGGLGLAADLVTAGQRVFLDVKLLDIPTTMERAVANAAALGVDMVTIHGPDTRTVAAAVAGRGRRPLRVLAVTVLTSIVDHDLAEHGVSMPLADLALHRARIARAAGADGVVASGREAAAIRAAAGPGFLIVTPGIRPPDAATGDQARAVTPAEAIAAGATHLVVGRPITRAADPRAAARAILADLVRAPGAR
jgi:orotidine-5'-phosphate decarboxylase